MTRLFVLVMTLLATGAAAVPSQITLTARIADAGSPLNGSHTVTVRMHGTLTGGLPTWTETHLVTVTDGLLFLTLGSQMPLDATVIDGTPMFAELQVDSTVLSPRLALVSVPYAVRSGVAENSARLGGSLPSDYALVNHVHSGLYLPLGPVLACTGTDKVVGLSSNGSVVCAPDQSGSAWSTGAGLNLAGSTLSVAYAGTGTAITAARSDHSHAGVYLPVGASLLCGPGQFVTGVQSNGTVNCASETGDVTDLIAGTGLQGGGTSGSVTLSVAFAGTGTTASAARSDHTHAGTYLPVGTTLSCPAGQKVSGLDSAGSVTCSAAVTNVAATQSLTAVTNNGIAVLGVNFAGTGSSLSPARSDHTHDGTYLPVGTTLSCGAGQSVTGVQANGSVTCSANVSSIAASASFSISSTNGLVILNANLAGTGSSASLARSDHTHTAVCPSGYSTHGGASVASPLCVKRVAQAGVLWGDAATACYVDHAGGQLCSYNELRIAFSTPPAELQVVGYWMGDRVDDDWVLRLNTNNNTTNFDEKVEIVSTVVTAPGFYCCQRAQ